MAETLTTRLALTKYGAGTDSFSRADWNATIDNIEARAGRDDQGTFAARPIPGVRGFYYWDTTNLILWRDTGTAWMIVGQNKWDAVIKSSTISTVALTVQAGSTGMAANLVEIKNGLGLVKFSVTSAGAVTTPDTISALSYTATEPGLGSLNAQNPGFLVGIPTALNAIFSQARVQARNNSLAATFGVNDLGGDVTIGNTVSTVKIQGRAVYIQSATPTSTTDGDVWIRINATPGIFVYKTTSASWVQL